MMRLFVGLALPESVRAVLAELRGGLPDAHWVEPEDYHITLAFIGEVDEGLAAEVDQTLSEVDAPPFPHMLQGIGTFGSRGKVHAVWAGVEPTPELILLQSRICSALDRVGIDFDRRKFKPHVTLARMRKMPSEPLERFIAGNNLLKIGPIEQDCFHLFRSKLTRSGPHYEVLADYPLYSAFLQPDFPRQD
ncbi:MAG: RNA 2',3'-cyclic phosphodiesterase [Rhodospirillaceae bacterium]